MKRKWIRYRKWAAAAAFVILAGFLYCFSGMYTQGEPLREAGGAYTGEPPAAEQASEPATEEETEPAECYVYICGEVINPGVYVLSEGQRLFEAVDLAGGFTENAVPEALNLVLPVSDGMKIDVPDKERAQAAAAEGFISGPGSVQGSKVNINTAAREQLMTLNGIGAARADAIIAYREEHGAFAAVEDIMQVSGIKEAAFARIKNDITVK